MNYFNTYLLRYGFNPDDFEDKIIDTVPFENGMIYNVEEKRVSMKCPKCGCTKTQIHSRYYTEISAQESMNFKDILRIRRIRYKCPHCGKTFTRELHGITPHCKITNQVVNFMANEFCEKLTFDQIATMHGITRSRAIQIFDGLFKYVPRGTMPKVLCIDEISFKIPKYSVYSCIISDFEKREIIDVLPSRKMPELRRYFANIPQKERENVKIFISDMYDAYDTICKQYFPNAIHIVDLFHVVKLLTANVNTLRTRIMNRVAKPKSPEHNFMKKNWKLFLCRTEDIVPRYYHYKKTDTNYEYANILMDCLKLDNNLLEAYMILQEMMSYSTYNTFTEALDFVGRIENKLNLCDEEILHKTAKSFHKWRIEIANGFNKRERNFRYTNSIAENLNNHIKSIVKFSYGMHNFERFRKRILLISRNKKA